MEYSVTVFSFFSSITGDRKGPPRFSFFFFFLLCQTSRKRESLRSPDFNGKQKLRIFFSPFPSLPMKEGTKGKQRMFSFCAFPPLPYLK